MAWPAIAISEPNGQVRRIGVLVGIAEGDVEVQPSLLAFQQVLQDLGWTDGRNVRIDYRFAVSDPQRIRAAAYLLGLKPDVLVCSEHARNKGAAGADPHCPDRVPDDRRSGRQRFGPELRATRRQRHGVHQF